MDYAAYPAFWDDEWVTKHVEQARQEAAARLGQWLETEIPDLRFDEPALESPLEAIFYTWWRALTVMGPAEIISLSPQRTVKVKGRTYRLDFAVSCSNHLLLSIAQACGVPLPKIAIELDGHEFHERTKAQVAERNERDRALQQDGWTVLHYSGSEIHNDPSASVHQAVAMSAAKFYKFSGEVRREALRRLRQDDKS